MPSKRSRDDTDDSSSTSAPKKTRVITEPKKAWTHTEEVSFLSAIDALVKKHMWEQVKKDGVLVHRGANGIRSHWDALYKKLAK